MVSTFHIDGRFYGENSFSIDPNNVSWLTIALQRQIPLSADETTLEHSEIYLKIIMKFIQFQKLEGSRSGSHSVHRGIFAKNETSF